MSYLARYADIIDGLGDKDTQPATITAEHADAIMALCNAMACTLHMAEEDAGGTIRRAVSDAWDIAYKVKRRAQEKKPDLPFLRFRACARCGAQLTAQAVTTLQGIRFCGIECMEKAAR